MYRDDCMGSRVSTCDEGGVEGESRAGRESLYASRNGLHRRTLLTSQQETCDARQRSIVRLPVGPPEAGRSAEM